MTNKQIKEYFGHRFPKMASNPTNYSEEGMNIKLDRAGQVVSIQYDKLSPVEDNYKIYDGDQWLQHMNWLFKGQPLTLCIDNIRAMRAKMTNP